MESLAVLPQKNLFRTRKAAETAIRVLEDYRLYIFSGTATPTAAPRVSRIATVYNRRGSWICSGRGALAPPTESTPIPFLQSLDLYPLPEQWLLYVKEASNWPDVLHKALLWPSAMVRTKLLWYGGDHYGCSRQLV